MSQVQRRRFLVGGSALLAAQLAGAQVQAPNRVRIVGYLASEVDPKLTLQQDPPLQRFRKLGWIEGQNIVTERRYAENKLERLPELAQELIRRPAEVIVTNGPAATLAVARATSRIPIVFFNVPFPVEQGVVDSFARPGRNVTGTTPFITGIGAKRFEFLRDIAPAVKRVYVMSASENVETLAGGQFSVVQLLVNAGRSLGFEIKTRLVREGKDVESALAEALSWGAQALFIGGGTFTFGARNRIAEFALQHSLPSFFSAGGHVEVGGLLYYGITLEEFWAQITRAMEYVDRILKGARPSDLPVEQPRNYELVINAKTAKALGLAIPPSVLLRANRVIE